VVACCLFAKRLNLRGRLLAVRNSSEQMNCSILRLLRFAHSRSLTFRQTTARVGVTGSAALQTNALHLEGLRANFIDCEIQLWISLIKLKMRDFPVQKVYAIFSAFEQFKK
jgi:hypothetical protein